MTELALQPALELVTPALDHQIADYLLSLLPPGRPHRLARMSEPGELKREYDKKAKRFTGRMVPRDKYEDISGPLTRSMLVEHARGNVTYSYMLDLAGKARIGAFDVDNGGRAALVAALETARALGITAFAIVLPGEQHDGGHVYAVYNELYDAHDINAQMQLVVERAGLDTTEIWPGYQQGIRGLFGIHQTKGTRGTLILQSGEVVDLDTDLAAGFALVEQLPTNSAPPHILQPLQVTQSSHKRAYAQSEKPIIRQSPGEAAAGRASLDDVRARFNAEHTIESVLDQWGKATETRDGWACACGVGHTHETTLYISKRGRLFSYSPRCHLHTTKGWDAFGLYVFLFHNNNVVAAAKELNPIQPRKAHQEAAQPATVYRTAAQDADAERKRAERRAAAAATLVEIQARASQDAALSDRAQLVLLALLETAGARDWTRASVARLAELTELCERYTHEALRELEKLQYIASGRRNGSTTFRTFIRLQDYVKYADESILRACEGGASSPCHENVYADTIEDWAWCADEHGADELSALEIPPEDEPEAENLKKPEIAQPETANFAALPTLRHFHGRYHVTDGARFGDWSATEAGAWLAWQCLTNGAISTKGEADLAQQEASESEAPAVVCATPVLAETILDMDEIDRWVKEIQAVADARRDERHEPQRYWEKHEAQTWREAHPVAPMLPAAISQADTKTECNKARLREKWDAMGDDPRALGRELAIMRNYLKSHPSAIWPRWQITELNDRIAALTPVFEAVEAPRSQAPARRPAQPASVQGGFL